MLKQIDRTLELTDPASLEHCKQAVISVSNAKKAFRGDARQAGAYTGPLLSSIRAAFVTKTP
jgi:hypothetical protein